MPTSSELDEESADGRSIRWVDEVGFRRTRNFTLCTGLAIAARVANLARVQCRRF